MQQQFTNGTRVKWRYQGVDQNVILVNLASFQALEQRVNTVEDFTDQISQITNIMENTLANVQSQAANTAQQLANLLNP